MKGLLLLLAFPLGAAADTLTCVCSRYVRTGEGSLRSELVELYQSSDSARLLTCSSTGSPWLRAREILPIYFDCKAVKIEARDSELEWTFSR